MSSNHEATLKVQNYREYVNNISINDTINWQKQLFLSCSNTSRLYCTKSKYAIFWCRTVAFAEGELCDYTQCAPKVPELMGIKCCHEQQFTSAPTHKCIAVRNFPESKSVHVLDHPANSPDLSPYDHFLLPKLKMHLKELRLDTILKI